MLNQVVTISQLHALQLNEYDHSSFPNPISPWPLTQPRPLAKGKKPTSTVHEFFSQRTLGYAKKLWEPSV